MYGAHAELATMQEAYDLAVKQGRLVELQKQPFVMTVVGRDVCRFCRSDIPLMAEKMGLSSIVIYDKNAGLMFYWSKGRKELTLIFTGPQAKKI